MQNLHTSLQPSSIYKSLLALVLAISCMAPVNAADPRLPLSSVLPGAGVTVGVDLAHEVQAGTVLPPANGGSGAGTFTQNGVLFGNGTSAIGATAAGTNGQLVVGGTSVAPAFASLTSTGNTITVTGGSNTLNVDSVAGIQHAQYTLTEPNIIAMNGAPVTVLAGVSGKTIVPIDIFMTYTEATSAYGSGGAIVFQHHTSTGAITGTVAATQLTAASGSTYSDFQPITSVAAQNDGIDITNATGAFTRTTATGTAIIDIYYRLQ